MIYVMGNIEVDASCYEYRRDGEPQPMQPQVFNVLHYLITNRHRVVSKHELLDTLWPDQHVSESALTQRIRAARRSLGDSGERQTYIKTLYGRGYRFIAPVAVHPAGHCDASDSLPKAEPQHGGLSPTATCRELIETALTHYAQRSATSDTIRTEVVFDRHRNRYRLTHIGRDQQNRVDPRMIHIDVIDDTVWIRRDDTHAGLITALIQAGIPKSHIRSGNQPLPSHRAVLSGVKPVVTENPIRPNISR